MKKKPANISLYHLFNAPNIQASYILYLLFARKILIYVSFLQYFSLQMFFFCSNTNSNQINAFSHIEITKHTLNTSHVAENGRTANPTSKSATAKLTIKKFVTLLSLCEQNTAAITKQLPTITNTFINARTASDTKFPGSVHFTESISVQLLIALH